MASNVSRRSVEKKQQPKKGRRYSPAEKREILERAERDGLAAAAREFGCTTWTIRRWRKAAAKTTARERAAESAAPCSKALSDAAGSPISESATADAVALSPEQEERHKLVLEVWRTNPGFGPSQIRNQLKRQGYRVSVHTVRDIMDEHGYIQPGVKPKTPPRSYEAVRPMQLYHLDFGHFRCHKQRQCFLLIEDDASRFIAGWTLLAKEHADGVIDAFDEAVLRYGRPEGVMVDRGSAFYSFRGVARFERHITEDNIDYYPVDEAPKNGKVERAVQTVKRELITQVEFADLEDAQLRFAAWVHAYNYRRTHMALRGGMLVPADRFHGMEQDVLRRLEQGNGDSPFDVLAPSHRPLEILRVCSIGGRPSVYLLGQKILG